MCHHPLLGRWGHKTRSKAQPPPEFQPTQELSSLYESATLMDVKKTHGTLTTALAAITIQVDHLSQGKASQAATISAQTRTRAGGGTPLSPPVPPSTSTWRNKFGCRSSTELGLHTTLHWLSLTIKRMGRRKEGCMLATSATQTPQVS